MVCFNFIEEKEKNYKNKANFDYVEDLDSLQVIKCEHCEHQFKRKSYLKRQCKGS